MAKTNKETNVCKDQKNHKKHLCQLEKSNKTKEIEKITKTKEFICAYCRRAADAAEYLCSPIK